MRWQNLQMAEEAGRRLPGYTDSAVVRHFDAPEAMGINFYEVRAKSVINRVPEQSAVPFRWTINPYRGCTHACLYCASGDTQILMADGRTKDLADVCAGDRIYGTEVRGHYRRYVITDVLDHWETGLKPAFRTRVEDGTELVTSGDHRLLTAQRGWKHVQPAERPEQRPFLTTNNELLGTGSFAPAPERTDEYKRGYLCGMIRGDGTVGSYSYTRPGRNVDVHHRFRLALTDFEALRRSREFLLSTGVETDEFQFAASGYGVKHTMAIRTQARVQVDRIRTLIEWPGRATDDWCKGFLAGIFDAEGSYGRGILRICNTDPEIIDWTTWCLRRLGFDHVVEDRHLQNGMKVVRITGGLRTHLRFFHTTDPSITRKRTIEGQALKCPTRMRVESIEPLGIELPMYDMTTGTGDFISNGVVSHNCFARPTHKFLDMNAGRDFEKEIVVKVNAPEVLRAQLKKPSWKGEHIALGTNTDPYQWVEGRYKLMRGIWEAMRDFSNPCSVLTKSPLLTRDIDLMQGICERTSFTANLSIPTIDEKVWRQTEPHTPNPRARIEAVAELTAAGIPCGVLIAPLMPGVNDQPEQVDEILRLCTEAGATHIGGICLHLRGEVKELWFEWLEAYRPDLIPRYRQLYARGAYAPKSERERISKLVRAGAPRANAALQNSRRLMRAPEREHAPAPAAAPQESLF